VRRHGFDAISFLAGVLFAVLGLAFLFGRIDVTDLRLSWVWPIPLIALGLLMLFTSRQRGGADEAAHAPPPPDHDGTRQGPATRSPTLRLPSGGREDRGPSERVDQDDPSGKQHHPAG
jgi:hypothetical protein